MKSTTLQTPLLISTKTIVNVELLTTNLNKLHLIGSYKPSRKLLHYLSHLTVSVSSQLKSLRLRLLTEGTMDTGLVSLSFLV